MTESHQDDRSHQLDIIALLDERFRLREDPNRLSDLQRTHQLLRERLRGFSGENPPRGES
jgi:hypothetical protein